MPKQTALKDPVKMQQLAQSAILAFETGNLAVAEKTAQQLVKVLPGFAAMHMLLGIIAHKSNRAKQAKMHLETAVRLQPSNAEFYFNLAVVLTQMQENKQAISAYEKAVLLRPDYIAACENLAVLYYVDGQADKALEISKAAIAAAPLSVKAYANFSEMLCRMGHYQASEENLIAALALGQEKHYLYRVYGDLCCELEDYQRAVAMYDQALALDATSELAMWGRGKAQLYLGNLTAGWQGYNRPLINNFRRSRLKYIYPRWQGEALAGKTLLVVSEQGIGDEVIFANCYADLVAQAKLLVVVCDKRLQPLLQRTYPTACFIGVEKKSQELNLDANVLPSIDYMISAGSVPHYLRPTVASFPKPSPRLQPNPERIAQYQLWLAQLPAGNKIGISWRSSIISVERDYLFASLRAWAPIFALSNSVFINLQAKDYEQELNFLRQHFACEIYQAPELDLFNDIEGCCALMSGLDWIIAPANSLGMFAGGLGCPAVVVHKRVWEMLGTQSMPWFSELHYVIADHNDWQGTMQRVAALSQSSLAGKSCKLA
jgi:Flp pilus assembly protein TadD